MSRRTAWTMLAGLALLAGCGGGGGACETSGDCAGGQVCTEGLCGACSDEAQCAHLGAGASCVSGACVSACGEGGCACEEGAEGCACRDGACDEGLACDEGVCAPCEEGSGGCACRATADACDPGFACEAGTCAACTPGEEGCACDEGACEGSLVCTSAELCLAPATCGVLFDAGLCPAGRACEIMGGIARCLDACAEGFEDDGAGTCVPCGDEGCAPPVTCDDCAAMHRVCEDGGARCGACSAGYRLDEASGECIDERTCGEVLCGEDQVPEHHDDGTCECVPRPCGEGEAQAPDGSCVTCSLSCDGEGEAGTIDPRTTLAGLCVCTTEPGYFVSLGGDGSAARCDEDGDGWVRQTAISARDAGDPVLFDNARCDVREVAHVELANEYGQRLSVWSCTDGLFTGEDDTVCGSHGGAVEPIQLVESDRNDSPSLLAGDRTGVAATAPAYELGGAGRALEAAELNALTNACVSAFGDFDDDGTADVAQAQPAASTAADNAARLAAFAYFIELHTAAFVPSTLGGAGTIAITERSRCDEATFPLGYELTDGAYWRECHRRRRPDAAHPWADFAQWTSCGTGGACGVALPPEGAPADVRDAGPHGLCELGAGTDWGAWRGMHHHSQFRCVLADDGSSAAYAVPASAIRDAFDGGDGGLSFQRCRANDASASAPFTCALEARPAPGAPAQVGWAAVRYGGFGATEGCIDEAAEPSASGTWAAALCPDPSPLTLFPFGAPDDFGRLECGNCDTPVRYVRDADHDGYGAPGSDTLRCVAPDAAGEFPDLPGERFIPQRADGLFDCDDADVTIRPSATDVPDLSGIDRDCDGVDGDVDQLLFVDPLTGTDGPFDPSVPGSPGTRGAPFRTIHHALGQATAAGRDLALRAALYELDTTIVLPDGVSLFGGYEAGFGTRLTDPGDPDETAIGATSIVVRALTAIPLGPAGGEDPLDAFGIETIWVGVALDASAVGTDTELQLLKVRAEARTSPPDSVSYYGLRGIGTSHLLLEHVIVEAASGSDGRSASASAVRPVGATGGAGTNAQCGQSNNRNGGPGAVSSCGGSGGRGGNGDNDSSAYSGDNGSAGAAGPTALGGAIGGTAGAGGAGRPERTLGDGGREGGSGGDGAPPDASAMIHEGWWIPRRGWPGARGGAGGGGGGGGGGDGILVASGSGGGGGGAGGCGGDGGNSGYGGGASFGAFFVGASDVEVRGSRIEAGAGGAGGAGVVGGLGGLGGAGGPGGTVPDRCPVSIGGTTTYETPGRGASGGRGGDGGQGGHGAGAEGGDSIALVGGTDAVSVDAASTLRAGTVGAGGEGAIDDSCNPTCGVLDNDGPPGVAATRR